MKRRLDIGGETYRFETDKEMMEAIKAVVIHHQGQLSTLSVRTNYNLTLPQESFVAFNVMDALPLTARDDEYDLEVTTIMEAIQMGDGECNRWMDREMSGEGHSEGDRRHCDSSNKGEQS